MAHSRVPRRRSRRRVAVVTGLLLILLPVGAAHLAQTAVPVTRSGQIERPVDLSASLVADPATIDLASGDPGTVSDLSATLTAGERPVEGALVGFAIDGRVACTARTDARGTAVCLSLDSTPGEERPLTYEAVWLESPPGVRVADSGDLTWAESSFENDAARGHTPS